MILTDVSAERAVLGGICNHGANAYYDIADIISDKTFTVESNAIVFRCLKQIIESDPEAVIDIPIILSTANALEYGYLFKKNTELEHLKAITKTPVVISNVRKFAALIRKLEIARLYNDQLERAQEKLLDIKGTETVSHILGIGETAVLDFSSLLNNNTDDEPASFFENGVEHLQNLADNPVDCVGIPTGFLLHDAAIGGGLRNGGVHVIAARMKVGKSTIALKMGCNIALNNIPVLYLDTEMMLPEQTNRVFAMLTKTPFNDIETGKFATDMFTKRKVFEKAHEMRNNKIPFYYKDIAGMAFEDILSIARRWIVKKVGLNSDGTAKQCVIVYDYLKLMSSEGISNDLKETQLLGFMMTGLVNFSKRYNIPVLTAAQTNRDGVNKETTDIIGGSDRIAMYCTSLSLLKIKSPEEIAQKPGTGDRKLLVMAARYGSGGQFGDYIDIRMNGRCSDIEEVGQTSSNDGGMVIDDEYDDDEEIPFG